MPTSESPNPYESPDAPVGAEVAPRRGSIWLLLPYAMGLGGGSVLSIGTAYWFVVLASEARERGWSPVLSDPRGLRIVAQGFTSLLMLGGSYIILHGRSRTGLAADFTAVIFIMFCVFGLR